MQDQDRIRQQEFNEQMPIIPHEEFGADCCGCIVVVVKDGQSTFCCNECWAVVSEAEVQRVFRESAAESPAEAKCPHCGHVNSFPLFSTVFAFTCEYCGKGVGV